MAALLRKMTSSHAPIRRKAGETMTALLRNMTQNLSTQNDVEPRPNPAKSWRNNDGVATQYDAEPIKRYHSD